MEEKISTLAKKLHDACREGGYVMSGAIVNDGAEHVIMPMYGSREEILAAICLQISRYCRLTHERKYETLMKIIGALEAGDEIDEEK